MASEAARNRGKSTTLSASLTAEGMEPCAAGSTTKALFEAYVEQVLASAAPSRRAKW